MYCIDCDKMICSKCLIQGHKTHNFEIYEDYLKECKVNKEEVMSLIKSQQEGNEQVK